MGERGNEDGCMHAQEYCWVDAYRYRWVPGNAFLRVTTRVGIKELY